MSKELIDHDHFHMPLPVFGIMDPAIHQQGRFPDFIILPSTPEHGRFIALFTDEDLVLRFLKDAEFAGKIPLPLNDAGAIQLLAEIFAKQGVTHVGIDVSLKPTPRGRFIPIRDFLAAGESQA